MDTDVLCSIDSHSRNQSATFVLKLKKSDNASYDKSVYERVFFKYT